MNTSILAYLLGSAAAIGLLRWRFKKRPDTFGSAGWLPAWKASGKRLFQSSGLLVGDWSGLLPVHYRGSGHALTVAPTGSGKGTCAIIPNLLRHPWIFLIDPGGENTAICAKEWQRKGHTFYCLNPWGMHSTAPWELPAHSINPLDILEPAAETFASDADLLAEMIVTRSGKDGGSAAYFKDEAQSGIRAFLMHIVTTEEKERRNLLTLRQYITSTGDNWDALIAAMKKNKAAGGLIIREAAQLERRDLQAAEEFSAIMSTMKQDTNFIEDPVMQKALGASTADLAALKGLQGGARIPGCAVSVVIPLEYIETHAAYARLIVAAALWQMQRKPLARGRVLFLLDEFPALKRMDRIAGGLPTLRKYRVWLWPIVQNIGQLKNLYGQNWQTFMSNAGLKQFIGAGDLETAQHVSALCGETTVETKTRNANNEVSISHARRPLAAVDEIMTMPSDRQIVFVDALRPLWLRKTPYWHRPALHGLFNQNPYHSGTPRLSKWTVPQIVWGYGLRFCAWLVRPAPAVIAAAFMTFCWWGNAGIVGSTFRTGPDLVCNYQNVSKREAYRYRSVPRDFSCPHFVLFGNLFG